MFLTVSDESVNHLISTPESAVNVVSMRTTYVDCLVQNDKLFLRTDNDVYCVIEGRICLEGLFVPLVDFENVEKY